MSNSSPYSPFLEKLRLPQPSLQRFAVVSLFQKLRSSPPSFDLASDYARDAVSQCLRSSSPCVIDQAVRELCCLFKQGFVKNSVALLELQSGLEGCGSRSVAVFVKAIGFLSRSAFQMDPGWGRRFDPVELHPFVKALSCREEEVHSELIRQIVLFIIHNKTVGVEAVASFLRPFLIFSVIRSPLSVSSSMFVRDLIEAVASVSCSFASEAIAIIKLLTECLKYFRCSNEVEFRHLLKSAEYVVDAYVVVLKQISGAETQFTSIAQACGMEVLDTLFSLCSCARRPHGGVEIVIGLSKRLLATQKELGLCYLPGFTMVISSVSIIFTHSEFEHEHLSILKLLIFLYEWRAENAYNSGGSAHCFVEELMFVFPVISLLSSPSKSVKSAATFLLSAVERVLTILLNSPLERLSSEDELLYMGRPYSIAFRLLHHLWFQEQSHFPDSTYLRFACSTVSEDGSEPYYWTCQLRTYLQTVGKFKVTSSHQSSEYVLSGILLLFSSIASVLIIHPMLGSSAVDSMAAIGLVDPKAGMPLLQAILFYCKMICKSSYVSNSPEMLFRLLEMLPSIASFSFMVPLIVQTILPMLQKNGKTALHSVAVRLLCKTWIVTGRAFGTLQEILDPKSISDSIPEREVLIAIAASIRDVCRHNPDRGVDLILSISSCIESQNSTVQALGLESLAYLCEADVVDFYTAWDVVVKHMLDYSSDPIVAHGLCTLLRWGAMDVAAYPEKSKTVMQILWKVATTGHACSALWVKARMSAFKSLSQYEVDHVQELSPDFKESNLQCIITEENAEVLMAMEEFEIKILNFEHMNRRRVHKSKTTLVHKVEKLLDAFPKVMFFQGNQKYCASELPGAALLSLVFTPKDMQVKETSKDLAKLHSAYEKALVEISESLSVSRNILVAHLALESWKAFIQRWMRDAVMCAEAKGSSDASDKISKSAYDIFKILCKVATESIPRAAVNIALSIGAFCTVVPPTSHSVISDASTFLLKWLTEYEHEHRQWSAAISLGVVCSCLHATDRKKKLEVTTKLLKVVRNSKSHLVKGACGVGLGFTCQNLLSRTDGDDSVPEGNNTKLAEMKLLGSIVRTLTTVLSQLCPSTSDSLNNLNRSFLFGRDDPFSEDSSDLQHKHCEELEEDSWGIAGLVMGLGNSVVPLYRAGAYDSVLKLKELLFSWFPQADSYVRTSIFSREVTQIPLAIGSCLALPTVMSFCQRNELINNDFNFLLNLYGSLISELLHSKKSGTSYQNLIMASCIGAGSFLSFILSDGVHSVMLNNVQKLLQVFRDAYTHPYPEAVQFAGMLGVINAFGAGAGDLTHVSSEATLFQLVDKQESSFIRGPLLSSPVCESLTTSIVQELFLVAKESKDQHIRQYSAWAISFLREKLWSKELPNVNSQCSPTDSTVPALNFSEDSLALNLCLWLRDVDFNKANTIIHVTSVTTVLRCLSKAPRLPALDWGAIMRRCMRYGGQFSTNTQQTSKLLREECICFSLAHANDVSSLLLFLDELTELSRFRTLELNMQSRLLYHLSDLLKIFSGSRLEKLSEDLVSYFCSSVGSYLIYNLDQRTILRVAFWKGLQQCLNENFKDSTHSSTVRKCMGCLFGILTMSISDARSSGSVEELSEAIKCLSKAPHDWLMDLLQVPNISTFPEWGDIDELSKLISVRAKLITIGSLPISELDKVKAYIFNTKPEGSWWKVLLDVTAAVSTAEGNIKRRWLLDAVEISCIAEYPSSVLLFIGLLSGICCRYMPLLIVDRDTVLRDLPVTLPSLLSESSWSPIAELVADKLWASTERICNWAFRLAGYGNRLPVEDDISSDEAHKSALLARTLHQTCLALKDYLSFKKQLRLANLDLSQL